MQKTSVRRLGVRYTEVLGYSITNKIYSVSCIRNTIFQKFFRCLVKTCFFIETACVSLRFDSDFICTKFFFCNIDRSSNNFTSQSAPALYCDHTPDCGRIESHTRRQHPCIGFDSGFIFEPHMISGSICVICLLIRTILLHNENRDPQFIDLK